MTTPLVVAQSHCFPASLAQVFGVVADVARYPEFVPGVLTAHVEPYGEPPSETQFSAALEMGLFLRRASYACIVRLVPLERIDIDYISGPFAHLENAWRFRAVGAAQTQVDFTLAFALNNHLYHRMAEQALPWLVRQMMTAFMQRIEAKPWITDANSPI